MKAQFIHENIKFRQPESEDEFQSKILPNVKKATNRIMDSVWTIEYNIINDEKVELIRYSRDDEEGYEREKELSTGIIRQDKDRTAQELHIWNESRPSYWYKEDPDKIYDIINKKHIFDYK